MKKLTRKLVTMLGLTLGCASLAATAQDFPARTVRVVVTSSAGTQFDTVARIMAEEMAKVFDKPVIVENKPGADQVVGIEYVLAQPSDGYTLLMTSNTSLVTMPVLAKELRFNPLRDLTPVAGLASGRLVFGSSMQHPWKNFAEFVRAAKANPGKYNYGSVSTTSQLITAALLNAPGLGLELTVVPYSNTAAYVQGLVSAAVHLGMLTESVATSMKDRFRLLAVTGGKRLPAFPDVPTLEELGYPEFLGNTYTFFLKTGTPKPLQDRINAVTAQVLGKPEVVTRFGNLQLEVLADKSAATSARLIDAEYRRTEEIARKIGLKKP